MRKVKDLAAAEGADVWIGHDFGDWLRFRGPTTLK